MAREGLRTWLSDRVATKLAQSIDREITTIRETTVAAGGCPPCVVMFLSNGKIARMTDFGHLPKDFAPAMIRGVAAKLDAIAVVFAAESWMVQGDDDGEARRVAAEGSLEDYPGRKEVFCITVSLNGECTDFTSTMQRNDSGVLVGLGPLTQIGDEIKGRFAQLTEPRPDSEGE